MDRSLYIAMTGAKQNMLSQTLRANNLANASTTGFRADFEQRRAMPVFGDVHPSRVYSMTERPGHDFSYGSLTHTGNDLDIAIKGDGWIAVQAPDGEQAYTRAGDLTIDELGVLKTGRGFPVLGNGGPITLPPYEKLEIGMDGSITIQGLGQEPSALNLVDRIRLVKPEMENLTKGEDGLFRLQDGDVAAPDATVMIINGAIENSNVNVAAEMMGIISSARNYELNLKYISQLKSNDEATARIMHQ